MKNGQTPIHIQRWAPADYLADEHVKLLQARRDYLTIAFYRTFIDASFVAGGDLPGDPEMLAAVVSMPKRDVSKALEFCVDRLIFADGDRLFQPRVRREIAEELEFRENQRENGKKGGRRASQRLALPNPVPSAKDCPSPPAPAPAPIALRLSPAPTDSSPSAPQTVIEGTPPAPPKISAVEKEFLEFWQVVERKDDKGGALKAWIKGRKSGRMPDLATVKLAYCRLAESRAWTDEGGKYHPKISTWLNREGWEETPRKGAAPKTLRNDFEIAQDTKDTLASMFPED